MAINLASKASPKVLERFTTKSFTEGLFSNEYDWTGVSTIKVYSVDTLPLQDYNVNTGLNAGASRYGTITDIGDTYQEMTVADHKSFAGVIDETYNTQQLQIKKASQILKRQTDEVIVPYVDKYRLTKLANGATTVNVGAALTKNGNNPILDAIFSACSSMNNLLVPSGNRVCFIRESLVNNLKLSSEILHLDATGAKAIVNGALGTINEAQIRAVPDVLMPDGVSFMIVRKNVGIAPQKMKKFSIENGGHFVDGNFVVGHFMHDCFVLNNRGDGIYVYSLSGSTGAALATPTIGTLSSGSVDITCTGASKIYYTLDGSNPKTSTSSVLEGTVASNKITVQNLTAGTKIRAYAVASGSMNSGVATKTV